MNRDLAKNKSDIRALLTFICPQDKKPVFNSSALTGGAPEILFEIEDCLVRIDDMRAIAEHLSIDREGFELHHHHSKAGDLHDDNALLSRYFPEMESYFRRYFAATRIVIFDATRRSDASAGAKNIDGPRLPAWRVHVDYTLKSGPQRIRDILGEAEATRLETAGARVFQINIWRPLRGPVTRSPLALADASSVRPEELIETDQIFPDRIGEIYHLAYAPTQRWYYVPEMMENEVLIIKGWDSQNDGCARFTPHGAFTLPNTPVSAPPRESVELRALVIIE